MANLKGMIASRMGLGDAFDGVVSPLSRPHNPYPPASASKTTSEPKQSPATIGDENREVEKNHGAKKEESQEVFEATPKEEEPVETPKKSNTKGGGRGRGRGRGGSLKRPAASSAPKPSTLKRPAAATAPPEAAPAEEVVVKEGGGDDGVDTAIKSNPIGTLVATYGNWQA